MSPYSTVHQWNRESSAISRGFAEIFLPFFHEAGRFGELLRIGIRQFLQDREMPDGFVKFEVLLRRHRLRTYLAETLEIVGIFAIDNDRRMPRRFVHDVGRGRVFDMIASAACRTRSRAR